MENQQLSKRRAVSEASEDAKACPLYKAPWGGSSAAMIKSELTAQPAQPGPGCCRQGDFWCLPCMHPLPRLLAPDFMVGWFNSLTGGKKSPECFSALLLFQSTHSGIK